jgi:acetyltransferase-like isoleucine patch superfamily enzyme
MSLWRTVVTTIKRADTPLTAALKAGARQVLDLELPAPRWLFGPLAELHATRRMVGMHLVDTLYHQPMFRARCDAVGRAVKVQGGSPYIGGDLRLVIGDGCRIHAQTSLVAGHVHDAPTLTLGRFTNLGPGVTISVGRSVTLGAHVRVAMGCFIADNPGHPLDPISRRTDAVAADDVRPVVIEDDVWLGAGAVVLPGVTIGARSIVGTRAVVTRSVPPDSLVVGNPARVVRRLRPGEAAGEHTSAPGMAAPVVQKGGVPA